MWCSLTAVAYFLYIKLLFLPVNVFSEDGCDGDDGENVSDEDSVLINAIWLIDFDLTVVLVVCSSLSSAVALSSLSLGLTEKTQTN